VTFVRAATFLNVGGDFAGPNTFFSGVRTKWNSWAIFKEYLVAASHQAADPIVAKYTGKLAAADVFTFDNAYALWRRGSLQSFDSLDSSQRQTRHVLAPQFTPVMP